MRATIIFLLEPGIILEFNYIIKQYLYMSNEHQPLFVLKPQSIYNNIYSVIAMSSFL